MNSFFIIFVHDLNEPGPPIAYRGDAGNVIVYDTRPEAEGAAAEVTATNQNPKLSFTVTEFQPPASGSESSRATRCTSDEFPLKS